jgi:quinol monooxygenase YgiN
MAMLFVRHTVDDYAKWKRAYDGFASARREFGVTGASIYRDPQDPNTLVVTHQFDDMKAAQAFAGREELKSAMAEGGVKGAPVIWFGEELEQTPY